MKKLSIAIDMGAKNNGVFICKSSGFNIDKKEGLNISIDATKINFSKKSRRENRHKDRNYKRRKLAKRLLEEIFCLEDFNTLQKELIYGLLNNRGYTFISTQSDFENLGDITVEFNNLYLQELGNLRTKENFEEYLTNNFDGEKKLLNFLKKNINEINKISADINNFIKRKEIIKDIENLKNKKITKFKYFSFVKYLLFSNGINLGNNEKEITKNLIEKENIELSKINFDNELEKIKSLFFEDTFCEKENKNIIENDLKELKEFFINIEKEIKTGSKPRKQYLNDIQKEISSSFDFIKNKNEFFNLIGNISNLQLRVLRKFFNFNSTSKDRFKILKNYFLSHHYKSNDERDRRKNLFNEFNKYDDLKGFLQNCSPLLTIPPYEDMNNKDTYKCNSMLIKPELLTEELKNSIDFVLQTDEFEKLLINNNGEFKKEELIKTEMSENNKKIQEDFTYSKYLQRILDATPEQTSKELNPRNVFKYEKEFENGKIKSVEFFKKVFSQKHYDILKPIAQKYYKEEEKINNGIFEENSSILTKCNTNTPYKNNAKHILLKPLYTYNFSIEDSNNFLEEIKKCKGLQISLERVSKQAVIYQNSFYYIIQKSFENKNFSNEKEIELIVKNLDKNFNDIKNILENKLNIKTSTLNKLEKIEANNLSKILNIFKQTYEILFKELGGFNKTCKCCTIENSIRSDENFVIAKRLLSDVAKPIDGMLDMMLDRLSYEITKNITSDDVKDIKNFEIVLEQNKFQFEENLNTIKRANNSQIKKYINNYKDLLNINICPYTGEEFQKGDWDHILPQNKGVFNSKANMIYCSTNGNQNVKGAKYWGFENLNENHLEKIFNTKGKEGIKKLIKEWIDTIKIEEFTNFDNLELNQQKAFRYALFMDKNSNEFKKAFELLRKDKIKTFSNGTQKRLARLIYEKLAKKFENIFKNIETTVKIIDSKLVSSTRKYLAVNQETGEINNDIFKQNIQNSHSHCIDAMTVFYLANSTIKGQKHKQFENANTLMPDFKFDDIYLENSQINLLSKNKTFINSPIKELGSYKLFDDTIYSENYMHIPKNLKEKELQVLIGHKVLYENKNNKKIFLDSLEKLEKKVIYKIDVQKISNTINNLFLEKNKTKLSELKFLDNLRYCTSRKEIKDIFFKEEKLLKFNEIKYIPPYSKDLYKSIFKILEKNQDILISKKDEKQRLNLNTLEEVLKELFKSKQKPQNIQKRKRGRKRHKFTLPILGSPKFRIKRGETWQILGNKDIATKNYFINNEIKPISFFTTNTIPLKISDLLDCLLVSKDMKNIYEVDINISDIKEYISSLKYLITEKERCTLIVTFNKKSFKEIQFDKIETFDGAKDAEFKKLLELYIENKELNLNKYIGSIRDGIKGKALLLNNTSTTITLQYKASINSNKKTLILQNI